MKYLNLFLLFIIIGIISSFGYSFWKNNKTNVITTIFPDEERFSIEPPPKQSKIGTVEKISGQIFWESRIATKPAEIKQIKKVQQGESLATGIDGQVTINFSESASLLLLPESDVEFVQTLPANFVFRHKKGEIKYIKNGSIPISIRALHLLVSINDGEITLDINPDTHIISLTVNKGSVKIAYNDLRYNTQTLEIKEGQKFIFSDDDREGMVDNN